MDRLTPNGAVVIGDIAFADIAARTASQQAWSHAWDADEYYRTAERMVPAIQAPGLNVCFDPVSFCGGLFILQGAVG